MAKIKVKKLHPIRKTYIEKAFPWACCLVGVLRPHCACLEKPAEDGGETNEKTKLDPGS